MSYQTLELHEKQEPADGRIQLNSWRSRIFPTGFFHELKHLMKICIPVIITNLLQFTILTESITVCGHISSLDLDGVGLANSMINAFGMGIGYGLSTACDTLFAQTYGSANKKRMGMILQRSILIISLAPILLWCVHINAEPIFILLGQDPEVARRAALYMRIFMPGLLFQFNYVILARYMQNQNIVLPSMIIGGIGNIFNITSQYIIVIVLGYGIEASAMCQVTTYLVMLLLEIAYILITKMYKETWDGWTSESLFDWDQFLALGIPGVGHLSFEVICWELMTFLSGIIGVTELAAQSILYQIEANLYQIPLGVGIGVNIRVGQHLGSNSPQGATCVLNVALCTGIVLATVFSIIFLTMNNLIPRIFTDDSSVVAMTSSIIPFLSLLSYTDSITASCSGALRGCGRQTIGAVLIIIAYWVIGIPCIIALAFPAKLDVLGLWIGIYIGTIFNTGSGLFVLFRQDWNDQAKKAQLRVSLHPTIEEEEEDRSPHEQARLLGPSHTMKHIRTPSQPIGCSIDLPSLPPPRSQISSAQIRRIIRKRLTALFGILLLFFASACLFVYLPRSVYLPNGDRNETTSFPVTTDSYSTKLEVY